MDTHVWYCDPCFESKFPEKLLVEPQIDTRPQFVYGNRSTKV